jgi:hypothetical protein
MFYKLLGLPETVTLPTAYDLLDVRREACTPDRVKKALAERKKHLRQNIPNAQFIPIILTFEKELDKAAAILLDDRRRARYDAELQAQAQEAARQREAPESAHVVEAVRETTARAVKPDGTMDEARRPDLARDLEQLGVDREEVRSILAEIPRHVEPRPEQAIPKDTLRYLTTAIDLSLNQGLLDGDDERRLLDLAQRLEIPKDAAASALARELKRKGARRTGSNTSVLRQRFGREVRSFLPEGRPSQATLANLVALGTAQGLSAEDAQAVLNELFAPPAPEPAEAKAAAAPPPLPHSAPPPSQPEPTQPTPGPDAEAELELLPPEAPSHRAAAPQPAAPQQPADLDATAYAPPPPQQPQAPPGPVHQPGTPTGTPRPTGPPGPYGQWTGQPQTKTDEEQEADHEEYVPGAARQRAGKVWSIVIPVSAMIIFGVIALVVTSQDGTDEAPHRAVPEGMGEESIPPASPEELDPPDEAPLHVSPKEPPWHTDPPPPEPPQPPEEEGGEVGADLSPLCQSLLRQVRSRDQFTALLGEANETDLAKAFKACARLAANPRQASAANGFLVLQRAATGSLTAGYPAVAKALAQLALCDTLRFTSTEQVARTVHHVLLVAVPQRTVQKTAPALRQARFATDAQRASAADQWEEVLTAPPEPDAPETKRPPRPPVEPRPLHEPAPPPRPAQAIPQPTVTAGDVTQAYSETGKPPDLLGDVALTLVACCDRAARLAQRSERWSDELSDILAQHDRVSHLADKVELPPPADPLEAGGGEEEEDEDDDEFITVPDLQKKLNAKTQGERYHAIELLHRKDSPQAVDALLAELEAKAKLSDQNARMAMGGKITLSDARTACRILHSLAGMNDARIPQALARMIGNAQNAFVACQIARALGYTLARQLGRKAFPVLVSDADDDLRLPRANSSAERSRCYYEWSTTVRKLETSRNVLAPRSETPFGKGWLPPAAGPVPRPGAPGPFNAPANPAPAPGIGPDQPPAWEPDPVNQKLLALVHLCADEVQKALADYRWGAEPPDDAPLASLECEAPRDLANRLPRALDLALRHLARLIRSHPRAADHKLAVEMVETQARARTLASDTPLQRAAVQLDAAAALSAILVQQADAEGKQGDTLKKLQAEHDKAVQAARNVLDELRENARFSLVLWDMFLAAQGGNRS